MKVKEGTTRFSLVGKKYVAKIPNPRTIKKQLEGLMQILGKKDGHVLERLKMWFEFDERYFGIGSIIRGPLENLREAGFYPSIKNIAVPTRFSILGIVNCQCVAEDTGLTMSQIAKAMTWALGDDFKNDRHTFANPDNFGIYKDQIRLRDYGGNKVVPILQKHRSRVEIALNRLKAELDTIKSEK